MHQRCGGLQGLGNASAAGALPRTLIWQLRRAGMRPPRYCKRVLAPAGAWGTMQQVVHGPACTFGLRSSHIPFLHKKPTSPFAPPPLCVSNLLAKKLVELRRLAICNTCQNACAKRETMIVQSNSGSRGRLNQSFGCLCGTCAQAGMRLVEMCQWQEAKGIARSTAATGWLNGQQVR